MKSREVPEISVIVPAYNEELRITPTLEEMAEYLAKNSNSFEIIVVNDGSSDCTSDIVRSISNDIPNVSLIELPQNCGKGCAVKTGALNSKGKRVLFADADGATPFKELARLSKALDEGAELAIGSRALQSEDTEIETYFHRKLLGRIFNFVVNVIAVPGIADTQCGFKLFTREAADLLFGLQKADGFSFDVELLYLAQKHKLKIAEVPINWENVDGSKVNLVTDSIKMLLFTASLRFRHYTST